MTLYGDAISKEVKTGIGQGAYPKFNGIGFPMGKRESNYVPKEYGNQLIKSQIKQLLLVNKGERVMLPNYGIGIRSYLFSNITPSDLAAIKLDIRDAIERYIPNATLLDLDVELADKTSIIITHRISKIMKFDKIIVLEKGELVEEGSHDYLIENGTYYPQILNMQFEQQD